LAATIALNSALSANGFYNKRPRAWSRRASERTHPACGALVSLPGAGLDVPLIYGLVAARLIIKRAHVGPMPVVIVTHEDVVDRVPLMELGVSRNE